MRLSPRSGVERPCVLRRTLWILPLLAACDVGVPDGARDVGPDGGAPEIQVLSPGAPGCGDGVCAVFADPVSAPGRIYAQLVALIDATPPGETIRGSMYTFARLDVADALVAAQARGVRVRVAVDQYGENGSPACADTAGGFASCPNFDGAPSTACGRLRSALGESCAGESCYVRCGIGAPGQACISPAGSGINHEKYFLFTRTTSGGAQLDHVVFVTSSNLLDANKKWQNAAVFFGDVGWFDAWVRHHEAQLGEVKNADYDELYSDDRYIARWSPRASGDHVVSILKNVTRSSPGCFVALNMSDFSDSSRSREVADQLGRIARLPCAVEVVGNVEDKDFAISIRRELGADGAGVFLASPATHNKYFLINAHYNGSAGVRTLVWTGSHNITGPALLENDENLVKIEDPTVFAAFLEDYRAIRDEHSEVYDRSSSPPIDEGSLPESPSPEPASPDLTGCGVLAAGESLSVGGTLGSCDGRFHLALQGDGNLVLYQDVTPLWSTGTSGTTGQLAAMQTDGNFVLYDAADAPLFASGTQATGAALVLQDDGNQVVYGPGGVPLWDTHTDGH